MKIILFILALFIFIFTLSANSTVKKGMRLTALSSMERIKQEQKPYGASEVYIKSAKNEVESFQVVVGALKENIRVIDSQISDLISEDGSKIGKENIKIFREEYVRVRKSTPRAELPPGLYPDPLVPFINPVTGKPIEPRGQVRKGWGEPRIITGYEMYAVPFEVFRGQNQPIWIDVYVPKDASSGVYKGKFKVTADGNISAEIPVTLTVWNFTLPDGPTHRSYFGNFRSIESPSAVSVFSSLYFNVEKDTKRFKEIEMRYCEAMAEHRINPLIPESLLPKVNDNGSLNVIAERHKALKKFIDNLHVTDFCIPHFKLVYTPIFKVEHFQVVKDITTINRDKAVRYYKEFYKYLKENGWEKRAYLYLWDEPNLKENYEQVVEFGELVHDAVPEMRCFAAEQTFSQNPSWPNIDSAVDIWCPLWSYIDRKSINEKIAHGDEVWSYTALIQRSSGRHPGYEYTKELDPPYWHIDRPLSVYRVPTWINWQYNITGLVSGSIVSPVVDPWWNPAFSHNGIHFNGGLFLLYPGEPCGIDGAISCMRLKNLRDGMEDYEYFAILEKLAGKEAVNKIVDTIAPNWWGFSKDPDDFFNAREKLAEEILKAKR